MGSRPVYLTLSVYTVLNDHLIELLLSGKERQAGLFLLSNFVIPPPGFIVFQIFEQIGNSTENYMKHS